MAIIWLVATEEFILAETLDELSGNFAVRRLGSLANLGRVISSEPDSDRGPDFCIVGINTSTAPMSIHAAISRLKQRQHRSQIFSIGEPDKYQRDVLDALQVKPVKNVEEIGCTLIHELRRARRTAIRKTHSPALETLKVGDLEIDEIEGILSISGSGVKEHLTPIELKMIKAFMGAPKKYLSRPDLLKSVWGATKVSDNTLNSHISRLRRKIEQSFECRLETAYGSGWRIQCEGEL